MQNSIASETTIITATHKVTHLLGKPKFLKSLQLGGPA